MIDRILTVITPATFRYLTSVDRVKADLGISDSLNDELFEFMISEASAKCETYCCRAFPTETVKEVFRVQLPENPYAVFTAPAVDKVTLERFPVQSISSVVLDGATLTSSDYEWDARTGFLYRLNASDERVPWRFKKLTVQYVGGYKVPDQPGRNLPADIEAACLAIVKGKWYAKSRDPLVKSEIIPQVIEREFWVGVAPGQEGELPPEIAGLLAPYRVRQFMGA